MGRSRCERDVFWSFEDLFEGLGFLGGEGGGLTAFVLFWLPRIDWNGRGGGGGLGVGVGDFGGWRRRCVWLGGCGVWGVID